MQVLTSNSLYTIGSNASKSTEIAESSTSEKNLRKASKKEQEEKDSKSSTSKAELTPDEQRMLRDLQAIDTEVRAHEAAHKSGGASTGAASYTYQQGPDGKMYAIGGEVSVSMKSGTTPEETIANAQAVMASAMAPANPSPQDYSVASSAKMMISKAQQQKAKDLQEELLGKKTYEKEANKDPNEMKNIEDESIKGLRGLDIAA